ncbi:hypothetical protein HA402_000266 [Bradysia odoriphaga]|nr:hypothetical protein HA402_000266 [Bradysia odoriphaga]
MAEELSLANMTTLCPSDVDDEQIEDVVSKVVPIFFSLIGITGLLGNALVVLVILSNPQMRSTTNMLIINLAMADLLFVIFCVPFTAVDYMLSRWPFGDAWCKIVQYLIVVTVQASIYTLVLMSLDRFLCVVYPIASRSLRTERNALLAILILWFVILTISIPVIFAHGVVEYEYKSEQLTACKFIDNGLTFAAFHVIFFLSSYLIPLILISGLYLRMLSRLWRTVVNGQMSAESHRGRKRVTRLVVVVVFAFASLWCPIQMILVLKSVGLFHPCTHFEIGLQISSHILGYSSSCVNPLLYAFLSENFRKAFRKIFHRKVANFVQTMQ